MAEKHTRPKFGREERLGPGRDPSAVNGRRLYNTPRWKAERKRWLQLYPLCVVCQAAGRISAATVVDHIQPHRGDQALFWDSKNWQSLCKPCHDLKTAGETRAVPLIPRVPKPSCRVVLVAGAPGSGKSHYIDQHRKQGDMLLDLDAIAAELSDKPLHTQHDRVWLRLALIERNRRLHNLALVPSTRTVWFPTQAPRWSDRRRWQEVLGCELVVVERDADHCARACADRPKADWLGLAKSWWSCYSSGVDETVIRVSM